MPIATAQGQTIQWGVESTKGTAVAATSKVAIETFDFEPIDAIHRPALLRGIAMKTGGGEFPLFRGAEWTANGYVEYAQLQNWLSMTVQGGVVGIGTSPTVWTFTRNAATAPALKSWTLERRLSDGTNFLDTEWAYSMGSSIKISAAVDEPVRLEVTGFSRRIQSSTLTPALALPTLEEPPHALSKVWIDSTFATIGTTQITGQVLDWSVNFTTGAMGIRTADGRTDMDLGQDIINSNEVGLEAEITMLVKADSGQYAAERTAAAAQTLRAVRIQTDGTSSKQLQIDFLGKHVMGDIYNVQERDGALMFTMRLQESTDGTNFCVYKLSNLDL